MPPELSDNHVAAICRVRIGHEVKFVIIGGMAARLHETGHTTIDVDICPQSDDANLSHLADALQELGARLRVEGDPDGVPFDPHPTMLRDVAMMTLITEEGPLDLCFVPAGFPGSQGVRGSDPLSSTERERWNPRFGQGFRRVLPRNIAGLRVNRGGFPG